MVTLPPLAPRRPYVQYEAYSLFQPEIVLPRQYGRPVPQTPERRLVAAVFELALVDAMRPRVRYANRQHGRAHDCAREDARAWFGSTDLSWPFSFEACCAILGLDPSAVRARVGVQAGACQTDVSGRRQRSTRSLPGSTRDRRIATAQHRQPVRGDVHDGVPPKVCSSGASSPA